MEVQKNLGKKTDKEWKKKSEGLKKFLKKKEGERKDVEIEVLIK